MVLKVPLAPRETKVALDNLASKVPLARTVFVVKLEHLV